MSKTCYLIGASPEYFEETLELLSDLRAKRAKKDFVIAVDGGYRILYQLGIVPDLLVGDFDSIDLVVEQDIPCIEHPSEKDDTDLYLAYEEGKKRGCDRYLIFAAMGGIPDHAYANYQMLTRLAEAGDEAYLIGGGWWVTALKNATLQFEKVPKGRISVFSATPAAIVTLKGLKYQLQRKCLTSQVVLGVSNEFIDEEAEITVEDGILLIFWEHSGKNNNCHLIRKDG